MLLQNRCRVVALAGTGAYDSEMSAPQDTRSRQMAWIVGFAAAGCALGWVYGHRQVGAHQEPSSDC